MLHALSDEETPWPRVNGDVLTAETYHVDESGMRVELASVVTLRRDGLTATSSEWISEAEATKRRSRDEARRRHEEMIAKFKREDPLYLTYLDELVRLAEHLSASYTIEKYEAYGVTYDRWCSDFSLEERRWCRRVVTPQRVAGDKTNVSTGLIVDLEWATETGPVKVVTYHNGVHIDDRFFMEHSVSSMRDAFAYVRDLTVKYGVSR